MNSSTSVSASDGDRGEQLPAIRPKAWWSMYLTSAARGLTAGLASPRSAGSSACTMPTVGSSFSVAFRMMPLSR